MSVLRLGCPDDVRDRCDATMGRTGAALSDVAQTRDGISTGFKPFPEKLLGRRDGMRFIATCLIATPTFSKIDTTAHCWSLVYSLR